MKACGKNKFLPKLSERIWAVGNINMRSKEARLAQVSRCTGTGDVLQIRWSYGSRGIAPHPMPELRN